MSASPKPYDLFGEMLTEARVCPPMPQPEPILNKDGTVRSPLTGEEFEGAWETSGTDPATLLKLDAISKLFLTGKATALSFAEAYAVILQDVAATREELKGSTRPDDIEAYKQAIDWEQI